MENPTGVSERIKQILAHYQLNANQASQKLGHTNASKVYKFLAGDFKPGYDSLVELLATWPEISGDWLLLGRGPMLRSEAGASAADAPPAKAATVPQRAVSSGQVLMITVDRTGKENTLLVPMTAQAGYRHSYNEEAYLKDMVPYHLPGFGDGTMRAFEVSGDSMAPTYRHRDIVVCSYVDRWDLLRPDESYVLVTSENVLLKRLVAPITDRRGVVELHSDNSGQYGVYQLPVADLLELWMVRGFVSNNAPGRPDNANDRLRQVIEEMGHNYHEVLRFLSNSARGTAELRGPLLEVK
jgi:phage repressor protein C with HTH and peptisase S24 domain